MVSQLQCPCICVTCVYTHYMTMYPVCKYTYMYIHTLGVVCVCCVVVCYMCAYLCMYACALCVCGTHAHVCSFLDNFLPHCVAGGPALSPAVGGAGWVLSTPSRTGSWSPPLPEGPAWDLGLPHVHSAGAAGSLACLLWPPHGCSLLPLLPGHRMGPAPCTCPPSLPWAIGLPLTVSTPTSPPLARSRTCPVCFLDLPAEAGGACVCFLELQP